MNKQSFLESIEKGKWFHVKGSYGQSFLVKMKTVTYKEIDTFVETLWLAQTDFESMTFSDYDTSNWNFENGEFITYGSSTYHFGSPDGSPEESIYTEEGELDVNKMKQTILGYAKKDFLSPAELDEAWEKLQNNDLSSYEELIVK